MNASATLTSAQLIDRYESKMNKPKNPFLPPGHYPMHPAQVLSDEEYEEYLWELAEEKLRHPEKFLPPETINPS